MRKPALCICENNDADQLRGTAKLISAFVFATRIVQSLYFLNTKLQASSYLLWQYSPVYVGPGRKPRRPVFSHRGPNDLWQPCQGVHPLAQWLEHWFFDQGVRGSNATRGEPFSAMLHSFVVAFML